MTLQNNQPYVTLTSRNKKIKNTVPKVARLKEFVCQYSCSSSVVRLSVSAALSPVTKTGRKFWAQEVLEAAFSRLHASFIELIARRAGASTCCYKSLSTHACQP